jgi:hypothetical protein
MSQISRVRIIRVIRVKYFFLNDASIGHFTTRHLKSAPRCDLMSSKNWTYEYQGVYTPSAPRDLLLEVLNLVPGVGQHVGSYVSQNCTE